MKFYIKKTDVYTNKKVKDANIICLTDLHYTRNLTPQFLTNLTNKIIDLNPTYICFLGDLCDDESYGDVIEWLNLLSKIAPVYFIYGNHDIKKYRINDKNYYVSSHLPGSVCNEIKNIDNLKILSKNHIDKISFSRVRIVATSFKRFTGLSCSKIYCLSSSGIFILEEIKSAR